MSVIGYINVSMEGFGGLLSLVFILCLSVTRRRKDLLERLYIRMLSCNTALLLCDAAAWLCKGRTDRFSFYAVRVSNFLVYILGYVMLVLFTHYLLCFLERKNVPITRTPLLLMLALMLTAVGLTVLAQFNGMYYIIDEGNIYRRQTFFWFSQVFGLLGLLLNGGLLLCHRRHLKGRELAAFSIYVCLPAGALLFQIFFYSIAVLYLATTLCLLCIYLSIQLELVREAAQAELELERSRTAIMLSQIQPHFLYNALNTIRCLCATQPEQAEKAIERFSRYLRGNMDAIALAGTILFDQELEHLNHYLAIERLRFPGIRIIYDLRVRDFRLPALTVQPLVENAVNHGLLGREEGGTITISTWEERTAWYVRVEDNGTGFDQERLWENDGRSHIGLRNTRSRLEAMCGGGLTVEGEPGAGTRVTMRIPKEETL